MLPSLSARNIFIPPVIVFALWLGGGPLAAQDPVLARSAAVVLVTLVLWSTGTFPNFLTSMIFFCLILLLKLAPPELLFRGFGSTAVWLVISGFIIGAAIRASGLSRVLAEWLAPITGHSYVRLVTGLTLAAMALGFIMPSSIGRAVVLIPVGMALAERVGLHPGSKGRTGVAVALTLACNMPSFAILPSNIPNMILAGTAETIQGVSFGYMQYLSLHYPVLGILKMAVMILLVLVIFPDRIRPDTDDSRLSAAVGGDTGKPADTRARIRVGLILAATLGFWLTDTLHGINPAWIGLTAAIILLLPKVGVVAPKDFNTSVDFGMVIFVASALGLGAVVNSSGLGAVVGATLEKVLPLAPGHSFTNFLSLSAMSTLTGLVSTVPGVPTVLTPMAGELANASGFSVPEVLMTQVIGFSTVLFPYQIGPLIVGMRLANEKIGHVMKITLPLALAVYVVLLPLDWLWWRLLGYIGTL